MDSGDDGKARGCSLLLDPAFPSFWVGFGFWAGGGMGWNWIGEWPWTGWQEGGNFKDGRHSKEKEQEGETDWGTVRVELGMGARR